MDALLIIFLAGSPLYHPTGFLPPVRHPWLHCLCALHRNIYLLYYFKNSEVLIKMFISKSSRVVLPTFGRYRPWRGQRLPDSQRPVAYWKRPTPLDLHSRQLQNSRMGGIYSSTHLWWVLPEKLSLKSLGSASVLLFELHRRHARPWQTMNALCSLPFSIKTSPSSAQFFFIFSGFKS